MFQRLKGSVLTACTTPGWLGMVSLNLPHHTDAVLGIAGATLQDYMYREVEVICQEGWTSGNGSGVKLAADGEIIPSRVDSDLGWNLSKGRW